MLLKQHEERKQPCQELSASSFVRIPLHLSFAHIQEIQIIPHLEVAIVQKYVVMEDLKTALIELVELVWNYPEIILYPKYAFLYDFLLKFGVASEAILYEICETQVRRLNGKIPASSLLVKQGVPEERKVEEVLLTQDISGPELSSGRRRNSRVSSNYSGTDSGFSSMDLNESSLWSDENDNASDEDEQETKSIIFNDGIRQRERKVKSNKVIRRSFDCTVCTNTYAFKGNCNRHITEKHPGARLYPVNYNRAPVNHPAFIHAVFCSICKKGFSTNGTCKFHIYKFHSKSKRASVIQNPAFKTDNKKPKKRNYTHAQHALGGSKSKPCNSRKKSAAAVRKSSTSKRKNISHSRKEKFSRVQSIHDNKISLHYRFRVNTSPKIFSNHGKLLHPPRVDLNCFVVLKRDF
jgi:hypothetical protein